MGLKKLLYNIFVNILGWGFIVFCVIVVCLKNLYLGQIGFIVFSIFLFLLMAYKLFLLETHSVLWIRILLLILFFIFLIIACLCICEIIAPIYIIIGLILGIPYLIYTIFFERGDKKDKDDMQKK